MAQAGTALIDVCAFWLSATTLTDLARRAGIDPVQAWMWPVIVDGMIVVATVAIVALARHGLRATVYPWALLIGGAAVSVTANCMHALVATDSDLPPPLAASVAAVPPLVLLAATHLTVQLGRRLTPAPSEPSDPLSLDPSGSGPFPGVLRPLAAPAREVPDVSAPVPAPGKRTPAPEPATPAAPSGSETSETVVPERTRPSDATRPAAGSGSDARDQAVAQAILWSREGLSNRVIASRLGVHPSTVGRWLTSGTAPDPAGERQSAPATRAPTSAPTQETP